MSSSEITPGAMWNSSRQQTSALGIGSPGMYGHPLAEEAHVASVGQTSLREMNGISAASDDWSASPIMAAGAARHIFAEAKEVELAVLMRSIELGNSPVASQIARRILGSIAAFSETKPSEAAAQIFEDVPTLSGPKSKGLLSPRELKVLRLIAKGWSNQQIAEATHRSINTIEAQIKSVYRKLAVKSRTQAVCEAMQQGLLNW